MYQFKLIATEMPAIERIEPIHDLVVRVHWKSGKRADRIDKVDLAPLIKSFKYYESLASEKKVFRSISVIDDGFAVAWNSGQDMSSESIEQLAEETFDAADFRQFLERQKWTHSQAAALLGRSRRAIEGYLADVPIPRVVVLACLGLDFRRGMSSLSRQEIHVLPPSAKPMIFTETVDEHRTMNDRRPTPPPITTAA